jgi:hypothetical protein
VIERRTLTRSKIVEVLNRWGMVYTQTVEAFELPNGWCLRSGSGIAGNSRLWFLWQARGSGEKTESVTTVAALTKLLDRCPGLTCRACKGQRVMGLRRSRYEANYPRFDAIAPLRGRVCSRCNGEGVGPRQAILHTPARFRRRVR